MTCRLTPWESNHEDGVVGHKHKPIMIMNTLVIYYLSFFDREYFICTVLSIESKVTICERTLILYSCTCIYTCTCYDY